MGWHSEATVLLNELSERRPGPDDARSKRTELLAALDLSIEGLRVASAIELTRAITAGRAVTKGCPQGRARST